MQYKLLLSLLMPVSLSAFDFVSYKASNGALDTNFIQEIIEEFSPDIFVETGTFDAKTAQNAAPFFKSVYTVELHKKLYTEAKSLLSNYKNVSIFHDSSPEMIHKITPLLKGRVVFWLDAHYSGEHTAMTYDNPSRQDAITPIRQELEAIKNSSIEDCIILIDDMRGFGSVINGTEYLGCWAYPSIQEVCALGKGINPNFSFALLGDIFLMYDSSKFSPKLSAVVKACTESRLYDGTDLTDSELLEHEKIIMHAQGRERAFISDLYKKMTDYKDPMFHHDLWYGLISMGSKNWQKAFIALNKVPSRLEYFSKNRESIRKPISYTHWRIEDYIKKIKG